MRMAFAIGCLGILLAAASLPADTVQDALTFAVTFEKNAGVTPSHAGGDNTATPLGSIETVRPQGISSGPYALVTGARGQAVAYSAASNILATAGTVTLWVQGTNWNAQRAEADVLFAAESPGGALRVVRDKPGLLAVTLLAGERVTRCEAPLVDDTGLFRCIAATYDAHALRLFIDGRQVASVANPALPPEFDRFVIGQSDDGHAVADKYIYGCRIYNRPLLPGEIAQRFWIEGQFAPRRETTLLKTGRAIAIDGRIDPEEWADATRLTAFINFDTYATGTRFLSEEQTAFLVTYDDTHLYVAMDSPIPEDVRNDPHMTAGMGGLLKLACSQHDASVDKDDAMEINIVVPPVDGGLYRMVVNGLNVTYDYTVGGDAPDSPVKGIDINWEPKWEVANTVNIDTWQVEARLPLADVVKVPYPEPGTVWGLNFRRLWQKLRNEGSGWTDGYRWLDTREFVGGAYAKGLPGLVRFAGSQGLTLRLDGAGLVDYGRIDLRGEVIARGTGARAVTVRLTSDSGEVAETVELQVPDNGAAPFRIQRAFADPTTTLLTLAVDEAAGGARIALAEIPCRLQQALKIATRAYPSFGTFKVEMDLTGLSGQPLAGLSGLVMLQDRRTGAVAIKEIVPGFRSYRQDHEVDIRRLPDGPYDVKVVIFNQDEVAVARTIPFDKLPLPDWFGNAIGNSETPPYPFDPVTVRDSDLAVWERRYQYAGGLFPDQITILGRKLLRAPMRLVVKPQGSAETHVAAAGATEWLTVKPVRAEGMRQSAAGDFRVKNAFWMEYDGFLWNRLVVEAGTNSTLEGLRLEIPFTPEFSDVFNPYDYSLRETGRIKPEGWSGGFRPIWVGNARGGLQWVAEHDGAWVVKDAHRELRLIASPAGATLVVTFVDQPVRVDLPLEIEFGLVATPVKNSRTVDYRAPTIEWGYNWYAPTRDFAAGIDGWVNPKPNRWIHDFAKTPGNHPYPSVPSRARKAYTGPYTTTLRVRSDSPEFAQFGDEWYQTVKQRATAADGHVEVSQNSRSYQDYFVYKFWQLMQVSPFASLYYDVSSEGSGDNPYAGLGYLRRDGTRVPSRAILGNREIMRRLYTLIKERFPDAVIKNHNSGLVNMAFMAFCDHFVEGECTINMLTQERRDYRGKIRPDTYRAEMMGHNFGYVTDFLYQFTRSGMWTYDAMIAAGPDIVDHIWGQTLLHDACTWDAYAPFEFAMRWKRPLNRHNWGMHYRFIPYWEQTAAKLPREELYASFYVEEPASRVIAIFYNDTDWSGELRIPLDWEQLKLGGPAGVEIENAAHHHVKLEHKHAISKLNRYSFSNNTNEYARIEAGSVIFPMTGYNYRMLVLQRKP